MKALDVMWRELNDAELRLLDVRRIRVTPDAIPGSPVTVPFTRERLRTLYLRAYPGGVVDAELGQTDRWRELLVHPEDWADLKRELHPGVAFSNSIWSVWGVRVLS